MGCAWRRLHPRGRGSHRISLYTQRRREQAAAQANQNPNKKLNVPRILVKSRPITEFVVLCAGL